MQRSPSDQKVRRADEFNVSIVLDALINAGAIDEPIKRDLQIRHSVQRARIIKSHGTKLSRKYNVSPIELITSFKVHDIRKKDEILDEDEITEIVANHIGVITRKIDPLKLDMHLITRSMSRSFARSHSCLPLSLHDGILDLAVANPWDTELFENLRHLVGAEIRPVLCSKTDIQKSISDLYGFKRSVSAAMTENAPDVSDRLGNLEQLVQLTDHEKLDADDRPIVNAVEYILHYAFDQRASDIHLEPKRDHGIIRMRIDGVLHPIHQIPRSIHTPIAARLKLLARMDIAEKRRPQDGRLKTRRGDQEIELRMSSLPVAFGEKIVLRIFDPEILIHDIGELGFFPEEGELFESWISRPNGLILVTGPTGSGKTTTLYSALKTLARPDVNIVTIEDPIEMVQECFNQIQIHPMIGLTFDHALRHVLRQDPDIIMVGEIRDTETANHAVQAAMTGHLVFASLHTNNAASAAVRMRNLGVPPFLLAGTIIGSLAQRLVRKVCPGCAEEYILDEEQLAALGVPYPEDHAGTIKVRKGAGCNKCRKTGYFGRTGIFELLDFGPRLKSALGSGADSGTLSEIAKSEGVESLREHALRKLANGTTSFEEVIRATLEAE